MARRKSKLEEAVSEATSYPQGLPVQVPLWAPTWPAGGRLLRPLRRLDHVLTGPGLVATSYTTGPAGGSDHRSIVADLVVMGAR